LSEQEDTKPDVLIVAAQNDGVAIRFGSDLRAKGKHVLHMDGISAARLFTIRVRQDCTTVTPSIPMFVRASCWWRENWQEQTADERFLRAEAQGTFRAVMSVLNAPVINRLSGTTRMTWGPIASMFPSNGDEAMPEIHASGPEMFASPDDSLWGESGDYVVAPISEFQTGTPLRCRRIDADALYEIVAVVGGRAFAATTDPRSQELDLTAQSVALVRDVGMNFATVTWAISGNRAMPVRLNAAPELSELRYAWSEISESLCADLLQ
jgi:hypothetical protein